MVEFRDVVSPFHFLLGISGQDEVVASVSSSSSSSSALMLATFLAVEYLK
jgi:hypothetical protein